MTLLADVVAVSQEVAATSARSRKVAAIAELLRRLDADEVPLVVGFLAGAPRQGRVGVGYATVFGLREEPAAEPSLTVADLDAGDRSGPGRDRERLGRRAAGGAVRPPSPLPPPTRRTSSGACSRASCGRARSRG